MEEADLLVIGAGFGGLGMAIQARRAGLKVLVLERRQEVGGTWSQNTYPGCACDTQSHHYSFSFALNPDWSQRFAPQPEILAYLKETAEKFGLMPHIRFGDAIVTAVFDEARSHWNLTSEAGRQYRAPFVVSAVGQLNQPSVPQIPGLADFRGTTMHTAAWDKGYDFRGKHVAVIGNGASAIQLIPEVAKVAAEMWVYQRSPNWLMPKLNTAFTARQKKLFRSLPLLMRFYRWHIYWDWEKSWPEFLLNSRQAKKRMAELDAGIGTVVKAPALREQLTPDYPLGCKRILLSDDFLQTMAMKHVHLVTSGIQRIEADRIVARDGSSANVDCIVLATGFTSHHFLPGMEVVGRKGVRLQEEWQRQGGANAYLGITVPDFPNFFLTYGPNTNLGHNSIVFMLECQINHILKLIQAARRGKHTVEVKAPAARLFQGELQQDLSKTAWAGSCSSWYKNAAGRIINNWSTHTVKYWWLTRRFKRRDYTIS